MSVRALLLRFSFRGWVEERKKHTNLSCARCCVVGKYVSRDPLQPIIQLATRTAEHAVAYTHAYCCCTSTSAAFPRSATQLVATSARHHEQKTFRRKHSQVFHTSRSFGREKLEGVERFLGLHGVFDLINDFHLFASLWWERIK